MKIKLIRSLYITDLVGLGGGETSLLNHLGSIDYTKFEPIVLCSRSGLLTDKLIKKKIRTEVHPWGEVKRIARYFIYYPFISFLRLLSFLRKNHIDIINANSFNSMAIIAPAAKILNIPLIWTCHGWWPTGKLSGRFINLFVDRVLAVSGFVKEKLLKEGHVDHKKIIKIPLGVDLSMYSRLSSGETIRREYRINEDTPLVGMIGRFQKIKGHHIFVEMAAEIIKTRPNICFMIVGSEMFGEKEENKYGREIKELILKFGIKKKIILTGFRQDVPQILKALDVLVVPSEIETFGMVVLEAMAMGVPVVNCARGGPTEIIIDGENGYNVSGQDPIKLGEKVKYLIDHPDIRSAMGIAGKKTVKQKYSIEKQITKIEKIYGQYLS